MTFNEVWATSDSEAVYQDTTMMIEGFLDQTAHHFN